MPMDFILFHLMCLYANFQMGHCDTLEFNPQTLSSELATSPQICPLKPTTSQTPNRHLLCSKIAPKSALIQP